MLICRNAKGVYVVRKFGNTYFRRYQNIVGHCCHVGGTCHSRYPLASPTRAWGLQGQKHCLEQTVRSSGMRYK